MRTGGRLKEEDMVQALEKAREELARAGVEDKTGLMFRQAAEEILSLYQERFGEDASFSLHLRKWNGDLKVRMTVAGEAFDPFGQDSPVLNDLLARFRNVPVWQYQKGQNRIRFGW